MALTFNKTRNHTALLFHWNYSKSHRVSIPLGLHQSHRVAVFNESERLLLVSSEQYYVYMAGHYYIAINWVQLIDFSEVKRQLIDK